MDAQIKKGILELCILFLVLKEDIYGYEQGLEPWIP